MTIQISTLQLLAYNIIVMYMIANQENVWKYAFRDTEIAKRMGQECAVPVFVPKFGPLHRFFTTTINTVAVLAVINNPTRPQGKFIFPCIIWNFYLATELAENIIEVMWNLYWFEVSKSECAMVLFVGLCMLCFHIKLTLTTLRYYDSLMYARS